MTEKKLFKTLMSNLIQVHTLSWHLLVKD